MKIFKKIVLVAFIGSLFITCKKEELPQSTTVGQPVFSFSGTIGSNPPINWQAGVNNYYMYSTFSQNPNGVYAFTGTLQNTANANNSIQITINDDTVSAKNASISETHINTSFSRPLYLYKTPGGIIDTTYSIMFTPVIYAGSPTSYSYNFGDGNTSTIASPTHVYTTAGLYSTGLTIGFPTGSVPMLNPITIYKTQPQLWINSISSTTDTVVLNTINVTLTASISSGAAPYTYLWNFGDEKTTSTVSAYTTVNVTHTYDSIGKVYPVNLKVTDNSGHSETYNYPIWADSGRYPMGGLIDYKMTSPHVDTISNATALSNVTINYTDPNGNAYTSDNALQPKSSSFQIGSVSAYQNNLSNNPTEMLKVTFNCMLYPVNNVSLQPIQATNCTAVIAVAY